MLKFDEHKMEIRLRHNPAIFDSKSMEFNGIIRKIHFTYFEMDRAPPTEPILKNRHILISTRRALSRQHKINAGNFTGTSHKITICAEMSEKFRSDNVEPPRSHHVN